METMFTWKIKLFRNKYEICQNGNLVGEIVTKQWSHSEAGKLNDCEVIFRLKGIFKPDVKIIDTIDNSTLAQVIFKNWKSSAILRYDNKDYFWKFNNFWGTKFSISNDNGILIKYHSRNLKGDITAYTKDEVLILAGLFIWN